MDKITEIVGGGIRTEKAISRPSGFTGEVMAVIPIIWTNPSWIMVNLAYNTSTSYYLGIYNSYTSTLTVEITCRALILV